MYFLIILLSVITLVIIYFQLTNEAKLRKQTYLKKFRHAQLYLISLADGEKRINDAFSLTRAENVIGRRDMVSNADIKVKTDDLTLSRNAAAFIFYNDRFVLQRLTGQKRIWIKTREGKIYLLCAPASPLSENESVGFGETSYETVEDGAFILHSGDLILMGNTYFEYIEEGQDIYG